MTTQLRGDTTYPTIPKQKGRLAAQNDGWRYSSPSYRFKAKSGVWWLPNFRSVRATNAPLKKSEMPATTSTAATRVAPSSAQPRPVWLKLSAGSATRRHPHRKFVGNLYP
jgi:hypothetical protein